MSCNCKRLNNISKKMPDVVSSYNTTKQHGFIKLLLKKILMIILITFGMIILAPIVIFMLIFNFNNHLEKLLAKLLTKKKKIK